MKQIIVTRCDCVSVAVGTMVHLLDSWSLWRSMAPEREALTPEELQETECLMQGLWRLWPTALEPAEGPRASRGWENPSPGHDDPAEDMQM